MGRTLEYNFSMHLPWAYIGRVPFLELVRRFSLNVIYKPISLPKVFAETGGLLVTKRHPARLRYRISRTHHGSGVFKARTRPLWAISELNVGEVPCGSKAGAIAVRCGMLRRVSQS
jgi:2-hydroxychromene-2-carboxylate isomerase